MCTSKPKKAEAPAAAPAPALQPADVPEVGETRRRQNEELYGQDAPDYRVRRSAGQPVINPNNPITM